MGAFPTDWLLFRRAAAELERALRGLRVTDAGLLDDGRVALALGGKGGARTLAADPHGAPPLLTLAPVELSTAGDPGWLRAAGATIRGMRVLTVRARRGDRVVVVALGTSSRFGVESGAKLVFELIPRYGNVVLLRDRTVVAALAQFSPAENAARAVQIGLPYEPPPLPAAALDRSAFVAALAAAPDRRARVRALGGYRPLVPRLIAESLVAEAEVLPWAEAEPLAAWLERRADAVLSATEGESDGLGDVHVYRDAGGGLVAAHVMPLAQFGALAHATEPALLPLLAEVRDDAGARRSGDALGRRRAKLAARVAKRLAAVDAELGAVAERLADAAARDRLRRAGEALYTHGVALAPGTATFVSPTDPDLGAIALDPQVDAKANAAAYFARYRKAADALPHLERRREHLGAVRASLDELAFEAERADGPGALDEIAAALDALEGRAAPAHRAPARARAPLRVDRPSGARIFVGRSPRENVEVTFRIARPDDLWFHARGIPGAHVVLQTPPGSAAHDDDLDAAAELAAANSRARAAGRVEIDYTERKYVRKRRDGAPGLVWYTNARTRLARIGEAALGRT